MILPITLTAVGGAALINIWLAVRCTQIRTKDKVAIGDGGNDALIRRMRAHANFIEFTPIVLALVAAIELAQGTANVGWLWWVVLFYLAARILHIFGMDGWQPGRAIGIIVTMITTIGLGGYALFVALVLYTPQSASAESGGAQIEAATNANGAPMEEVPQE